MHDFAISISSPVKAIKMDVQMNLGNFCFLFMMMMMMVVHVSCGFVFVVTSVVPVVEVIVGYGTSFIRWQWQ